MQSAEGTETGKAKITVTPQKTGENTYVYKIGDSLTKPAYNEICTSGYTTWDGAAEIEAENGKQILVVEITAEKKAVKAGIGTVISKNE